MKKFSKILLTFLCLTLFLTACGQAAPQATTPTEQVPTEQVTQAAAETATEAAQPETVTFVDGRDKEITVAKNPQRVVCTYGSYCPLWYECGGTLVYRRDVYSSYTLSQELEAVPVLADGGDISAEIILAAEPDLVIMNNTKADVEMAELLEAAGVPCLLYNYNTVEQYVDLVKIFTDITDRPDLYKTCAVDVKARVDAVREKVAGHSVEAVLIMPTTTPSFTSATTMCGSMLRDLNVKLLSYPDGDITKEKYEFSMEKLLEIDPQFILCAGGGADQEAAVERTLSWPGFTDLTAYKEGRYRHLDVSIYMYKPNSRYAEAYEQLAAFLYPDLFPEA